MWSRAIGPWLLAVSGCSLVSDLDPLRGARDAGVADTPSEAAPPPTGFDISLDPPYVVGDKGETHAINVTITRAIGFTDPISVALNGPPVAAGISGQNTLVMADDKLTAPITFKIDGTDTGPGGTPYDVEVRGQSGTFTKAATFHLHIGSLLIDAATGAKDLKVVVPPYVRSIDAKLWGAGGGGGGWDGSCNPSTGGSGGGGGYTFARVPIPGTVSVPLEITVGVGGGVGSGSGGGGGGYSAVRIEQSATLVIAGGGGGGARNKCGATSGMTAGRAGHSTTELGGNCTGRNGATTTNPGAGNGGGGDGGPLVGGDASNPLAKGGTPGGGQGGTSGGGGGAGALGGGAGGSCGSTMQNGGGGGGSGGAISGATMVTLTPGNGVTPGNANDPECNGVGIGGAAGSYPGTNGIPGGGGRVIVRLTKTP